eukprot:1095956-Amphidinium_carterae.1
MKTVMLFVCTSGCLRPVPTTINKYPRTSSHFTKKLPDKKWLVANISAPESWELTSSLRIASRWAGKKNFGVMQQEALGWSHKV